MLKITQSRINTNDDIAMVVPEFNLLF